MITKEQVLEWLKTDEGKATEKELITTFIQTNPEGKALVEEIIKPELEKAKSEAIKDWEINGRGKNLKEHNQKLLDEIKALKETAENGKKLQNLLDISGHTSYNSLEDTILSLKDGDKSSDEEMVALKKELNSYRIKSRDLEAKLPSLETERESLNKALQESNNYISNLLISKGIKSALIKAGFDAFQAEGLVHRVSQLGKFTVEIDEASGERKAVNDYGMTPEDYTIKEYLTSEEGKAFKPNKASGGGASGDLTPSGLKPKAWNDMSWLERNTLFQKNPEEYRKLRDAAKKK